MPRFRRPEIGVHTLAGRDPVRHMVSVFPEVEAPVQYLPPYAEDLDILTAAASR